MREITKVISEVFESTAIENALKLGISNVIAFGKDTFCQKHNRITLFVSDSYGNFCRSFEEKGIELSKDKPVLCSLIRSEHSGEELISVLEQLKAFPEGTTVIFTHNTDMYRTEKMLSSYGFRTVEHFSPDRVADSFERSKTLSERNYYCLCVRK